MSLTLPEDPDQYFIEEFILKDWQPSAVHGYDPTSTPGSSSWFPYGTSLDNVGASYPSLVIQADTNQSSAGGTTYSFMTNNGPGQNRVGSMTATVRVQDSEGGYTGDSNTYPAVDADTLASDLIKQVEDVCARNAAGGSTELTFLGSEQLAEPEDDLEASPAVRMASATISYSWLRTP